MEELHMLMTKVTKMKVQAMKPGSVSSVFSTGIKYITYNRDKTIKGETHFSKGQLYIVPHGLSWYSG